MIRLAPRSGGRLPLMLPAEGRHPQATFRRVVRLAGPVVMVLVGAASVSTGLQIGSSLAMIVGAWAGAHGLLLWTPRFGGSRGLRWSALRVRRMTPGQRPRIILPS